MARKSKKTKKIGRAKSSNLPLRKIRRPRHILLSGLIRDREREKLDPAYRTRILRKPQVASLYAVKRLPTPVGERTVKKAFRRITRSIPFIPPIQRLLKPVKYVSRIHKICKKRKQRRETLFALKKAGRGLKRSPGQGGTYRKTLDSMIPC